MIKAKLTIEIDLEFYEEPYYGAKDTITNKPILHNNSNVSKQIIDWERYRLKIMTLPDAISGIRHRSSNWNQKISLVEISNEEDSFTDIVEGSDMK